VTLTGGQVVVLRRWVWQWVLADEPVIAQREVDALTVVARAGLPAPRLIAADPVGAQTGDGVPALLMTKLSGRAIGDPDIGQLAETLATVHDAGILEFRHEYFRWCMDALSAPPPAANDPRLWERALAARAEAIPRFDPVFIHRDYQPGNVLWTRGKLSGVVDWALACRGPRECDVATCRSDLIRLQGVAAADDFLARYTSVTGHEYHPYWDLNYLLENDAEHWTPSEVQRAEPFMRRILGVMGSGV
jgi:aminoglycoside phosphotransferase (APT) family kinase protein